MKKKTILTGFVLASFAIFEPVASANAATILPEPEQSHYVADPLNYLTATESDQLAKQIAEIENNYNVQTGIVVVDSTDGQSIEQYAIDTAQAWELEKVSTIDPDLYEKTGILIVVAVEDRRVEVYAGASLSKIMTSEQATAIQSEVIAPVLTAGQYASALSDGLSAEAEIFSEYNNSNTGVTYTKTDAEKVKDSLAIILEVLTLVFVSVFLLGGVIIINKIINKKRNQAEYATETIENNATVSPLTIENEAANLLYKSLPNSIKEKLKVADLSRQTAIIREQIYINHKKGKLNKSSVSDSVLTQLILDEINGVPVTTVKATKKTTDNQRTKDTSSGNYSTFYANPLIPSDSYNHRINDNSSSYDSGHGSSSGSNDSGSSGSSDGGGGGD